MKKSDVYPRGRRLFWKKLLLYHLLLVFLATFINGLTGTLGKYEKHFYLAEHENETDRFRQQRVSPENAAALAQFCAENQLDFARTLAVVMVLESFQLDGETVELPEIGEYLAQEEKLSKYRGEELERLAGSFREIWGDLVYFPVPESSLNPAATVSFENSWMFERTYGGKRGHEGTDIMASINRRGYYPIVSMTAGVVENVGWLPKGGYRIGIRTAGGAYFYYAHLYGYAREFQEGDAVAAGELLGYMGDTGYSQVEGTTGMFDVHLHLGIYIETENNSELSVNPYWILKYLENKKLKYKY